MVCTFPFALVLALVLGFALLAMLPLVSFLWRLFLFWLLHVVIHLGCVFAFPWFFFFHSFPFCIVPLVPARGLPVSRIVFAIACVIFSPSTSSDSSCVSVT